MYVCVVGGFVKNKCCYTEKTLLMWLFILITNMFPLITLLYFSKIQCYTYFSKHKIQVMTKYNAPMIMCY